MQDNYFSILRLAWQESEIDNHSLTWFVLNADSYNFSLHYLYKWREFPFILKAIEIVKTGWNLMLSYMCSKEEVVNNITFYKIKYIVLFTDIKFYWGTFFIYRI